MVPRRLDPLFTRKHMILTTALHQLWLAIGENAIIFR